MIKKTLRDKIMSELDNRKYGKFDAESIADAIGVPLKGNLYGTTPNVRRVLTQLCKEGLLYQWVLGNGMQPFALTRTATYNIYYLHRDSELANTLINHPNRTIKGYRIR